MILKMNKEDRELEDKREEKISNEITVETRSWNYYGLLLSTLFFEFAFTV